MCSRNLILVLVVVACLMGVANAGVLFEDTFTGSKQPGWWNGAYTVTGDNRAFTSTGPVDQQTIFSAPTPTAGQPVVWELTVFANEEAGYGFGNGGAQGGIQWAWVGSRGWYQLQVRHSPGNWAFVEYMEKDAGNKTVDYAAYYPAIDFGTVKTYHLRVVQDATGHDMYINDIWLGRIDDTTFQEGGGIGMYGAGLFDNAKVSRYILEVVGDIDGDDDVDFFDFAEMAGNWMKQVE